MTKKNKSSETSLYCLDAFSAKARKSSFYIERLPAHLARHDFVSKPHKHDFYLLLYITRGRGTHTIDFKTYPVSPRSFFLMTPGQVHSWDLSPEVDGFIIFFEKDFYQIPLSKNSLTDFPFFHSLQAFPVVQLKGDVMIDTVLREMHHEFTASDDFDLRMLRSYLDILLLKVARQYPVTKNSTPEADTTGSLRMRKLEQLIEKNFIKIKQPAAYAGLMNISSSYLNTLCKQTLGKTLSDLINERVVLEARRLFAYSDLTVAQISERLGFSTSSYFVRFFRKHTGKTPGESRNLE